MNIDKLQLQKLGASEVNSTGSIGMKYDGGKQLANILFQDFPRALEAIVAIATFGAKKYKRNSWLTVPDALERYSDAMVRHQLAMGRGETYDPESRLLHYAHFAWNVLATLELLLRQGQSVDTPTPMVSTTNPFDPNPMGSGTVVSTNQFDNNPFNPNGKVWISTDPPVVDPLGR